jgi:hypothetical protein
MRLFIAVCLVLIFIFSCKTQPDADRNNNFSNQSKLYFVKLNPSPGSSYHYDMTNQSQIEMEVEDKEVNNINKSTTGINYTITKDSSGNYIFTINYDKVQLHTKNGDQETDFDAANAYVSPEPLERMLGLLVKSTMRATIDSTGQVKGITGYKELGEKIISNINSSDSYSITLAKSQWEKMIGNGIIKKNMDQVFKVFPDSAIHIGNTWRMNSREEGEIALNVKSIFTLKTINDDIAMINAEGTITSDNIPSTLMGLSGVVANLKGTQKAQYEVETKTGMLISCKIQADVDGNIQMMGREIPVSIKSSVNISGKKIK